MTYRARPYPRITKEMPPHKRKPRPQVRSLDHLAFIRMLGCLIHNTVPSQAAHIRKGADGARGIKPSDNYAIPLCVYCHAEQHTGEVTWWTKLGIDPFLLAARLWEVSGDLPAGTAVIDKARACILLKRYIR